MPDESTLLVPFFVIQLPSSIPPLLFTLVFSICYGFFYFWMWMKLLVAPISIIEFASLESLELKSILRLLFCELMADIRSGLIDYYLNSALETLSVYYVFILFPLKLLATYCEGLEIFWFWTNFIALWLLSWTNLPSAAFPMFFPIELFFTFSLLLDF